MIKNHQRQKFPGRDIAIELTSADLSQVAAGLGAAGARVSTSAEFADAVKEAVAAPVPHLPRPQTLNDPAGPVQRQPRRTSNVVGAPGSCVSAESPLDLF